MIFLRIPILAQGSQVGEVNLPPLPPPPGKEWWVRSGSKVVITHWHLCLQTYAKVSWMKRYLPERRQRYNLKFLPMPSLRGKAHVGVMCTFGTRTSATAAGSAKRSQLSSSRLGQAVRSVREGGMDRPSQHKSHPAGSLSSSQPARRASVLGHYLTVNRHRR